MSKSNREAVEKTLRKRYLKERLFRYSGVASISFGVLALCTLLVSIAGDGIGGFRQTFIALELQVDAASLGLSERNGQIEWRGANYQGLIKSALRAKFPDAKKRSEKKALYRIVSSGADYQVRNIIAQDPSRLGQTLQLWLPADDDVDLFYKAYLANPDDPGFVKLDERQQGFVKALHEKGLLEIRFNTLFFTAGDSREPEQAGIRGAMMGSLFTLLVTLALSFPIGVAAAIYLEEFAPKNRWTDLIEVNINNLAAVPSVVFGLLGLAVFLNWFGLPRSIPLVGGLVLTLITLPTIIISSRASLKSVPPSIKDAAIGLGASKMQAVFHHVLPAAMPGMLTGAIIGMAQALGETAPLLMIGMVAFVVDVPAGIFDPSAVLPVQIFLWADSPERAFVEKTSAAIIVLLAFLVLMNILAVILRKKFQKRW